MSALDDMTKILRNSKITPESKKLNLQQQKQKAELEFIKDMLNGFKGKNIEKNNYKK